MGLTEGDWVEIGSEVGRIVAADEALVLAECFPSGRTVDRPPSYANMHWTRIAESGLRVQLAQDARTVRVIAAEAPADIIVAALVDAGGDTSTMDLKSRITPDPVTEADWERWWGRIQPRLERDPRIDATYSRDKRYRLLREGEEAIESIGPAVTSDVRRGRFLADARQLAEARKLGRRRAVRRTDDDNRLIDAELPIAERTDVDPTDRYMAAELAVWVGKSDAATARALVGTDIGRVDLLRIRRADSRDRALMWALEDLADGKLEHTEILKSAAAAGQPWSDQAIAAATAPTLLRAIGEGLVGWAIPGDEDAGQHKYPDDLGIFENRDERAREALRTASSDVAHGAMLGAIRALETLPESEGLYANPWARLMDRLATTMWMARTQTGKGPRLDTLGPLRASAVTALVNTAIMGDQAALDALVSSSYLTRPGEYRGVFEFHCRKTGKDPAVRSLELARHRLTADPVRLVALHAFTWASESPTADPGLLAEVASLVGAISPDERMARDRLEGLAAEQAAALLDLRIIERAAWFSHTGWVSLANKIIGRLEQAYEREQDAQRAVVALRDENEQLARSLAVRSEALSEARSSMGADRREDSSRQAAASLKPVMAALADSYEAASLEALQHRLLAALRRARITPVGEVGDQQPFNPERHEWVGEGMPGATVQLISPGFLQEGDEEDVVLVPARVIAGR